MEYATLNNGVKMPRLGYGVYQVKNEECERCVVDAISAMPYPDHYSASGSWLPWEHPYETMKTFGEKAAARHRNSKGNEENSTSN